MSVPEWPDAGAIVSPSNARQAWRRVELLIRDTEATVNASIPTWTHKDDTRFTFLGTYQAAALRRRTDAIQAQTAVLTSINPTGTYLDASRAWNAESADRTRWTSLGTQMEPVGPSKHEPTLPNLPIPSLNDVGNVLGTGISIGVGLIVVIGAFMVYQRTRPSSSNEYAYHRAMR